MKTRQRTTADSRRGDRGRAATANLEGGAIVRIRPLWIAVPAWAAAGLIGVSVVGAEETPPKARPVAVKPIAPDTRAAERMFGPPPATGVQPASATEPPLFFPNAKPPRNEPVAVLPSGMPPPRITVESTPSEPKPLPLANSASTLPIISQPAVPPPSGPQPLLPTVAPQAVPVTPMAAVSHVTPFPDLPLLAKQAPSVMIEYIAPECIGVGQSLECVLLVRNTGTSAVANVRVEDELPSGSQLMSSDPVAEQSGDRLGWNLGTLDAGAEKRIKISIKPGNEGEIRSRAMVRFTSGAEARIKVTRPRIAVALTGQETARVGDEVPFAIKITNTGSGVANNVLIKARLSEGLHHPAGSQIEAMIDRLQAGESKTITLRAMATRSGANNCQIHALGDGLVAESATANVAVVEPMLQAKIVGPVRCNVRAEPEYRIDLANPGTAATDPVRVWVVLPEGFDFISAGDAGTHQALNRTVIWTLPALAANATRSLSLKLKASTATEGNLKLIAQAAPAAESGVITASAKAAANSTRILEVKTDLTIKSEGVPALRFEVADVEDPVEVGKEALYDIRIVNQGTGPCTNVVVTAHLADGTVTVGANGPTTARGQGQQIVFDPLPTLAAKGEAVYRVRIRGTQAGDMKLRVQVVCDEIRTPAIREEITRFFKD